MKSILLVAEQFTIGGLETHIQGEIRYLQACGLQVHLVVGERFSEALVPSGLASLNIGLQMGVMASTGAVLDTFERISSLIREHSIDVVHVHPFGSIFPAMAAAQAQGIPAVVTLHGPASLEGSAGPLHDFLLKQIVLPSASAIICVSNEVRNAVAPYVPNENLHVFPNGVQFSNNVCKNDAHDPRWCMVSRLDDFKIVGIYDFISKAKQVGIPGVLVVGDGPAKEALQQKLTQAGLTDYVDFYGYCADVPLLMASHVGVAGMGRVLLEGIAASKTVVLVGYDSVKGVMTSRLFEEARGCNFSGRGMESVSADVLSKQLEAASERGLECLREEVCLEFEQGHVWSRFYDRLRLLKPMGKCVLQALFETHPRQGVDLDTPMLGCPMVEKSLRNLVSSVQYFSPRLTAAIELFSNQKPDVVTMLENNDQKIASEEMNKSLIQLRADFLEATEQHDVQLRGLHEKIQGQELIFAKMLSKIEDGNSLQSTALHHEAQIKDLEFIIHDHKMKLNQLSQRAVEGEALLKVADAYRDDKEIYIAQLLLDVEMRNSGFSGLAWRVDKKIQRASHYVNRSRQIVASGGLPALLRAIRSKVSRRKGILYRPAQMVEHGQGYPISLAIDKNVYQSPSLQEDELVILTGVPFDDIGGGQRGAQLARCALKTGRNVVYIYVYPKYDFETESHVASEVSISGMKHVQIDNITPEGLLEHISERATVVVEIPHPKILPFLQASNLRGVRTVFELIDDWETSLGGDWFDAAVYRQFVMASQVVVGTAKVLVQRLQNLGRKDAQYLPNASNEYIFDKYKSFERPADLPRGKRTALYFGSLYGEWFAWDYIEAAAVANPQLNIVLIGDNPKKNGLPGNVHFLGARKIDELPAYLAYSDMALIPFVPGKISDAVSPIKVFEYLFMGKPVISTSMPEILDYPGVYVADSPQEYALLCGRDYDGESLISANDKFISENSWYSRLDKLVGDDAGGHITPSVSVVVLIHNNKKIIGRCLDSMLLHGSKYIREIIVVDNASSDGGADYVRGHFPAVRVVVNEVNGCSSGRNLGASLASGKYIAFFDSDQWITSASGFSEALHILTRDASVGVVGWGAGWFDVNRSDLGGMIADYCANRAMNVEALTKGYRSDIGYLGTCGFFVPKSVFEATGGFDTFYDPTCFEDTDLSFQIKKLGLKVCFRDLTGIRHQPHQTTKANSQSSSYTKLFLRNSEYFKEKWKNYPEYFVDYPGE